MKRYRNISIGTVFEIPLGDRRFSYICAIGNIRFWLYEFISDVPVRGYDNFNPSRWLLPFVTLTFLPCCFRPVEVIPLSDAERKPPLLWVRVPDKIVELEKLPSRYRVFDAEVGNFYISEEEAAGMFQETNVDPDDLVSFIQKMSPQLKVGTHSNNCAEPRTVSSSMLGVESINDDAVVIEIRTVPECAIHRDHVEDELDFALQEAGVGDMIGAGGGVLGNWDLVVNTRESDLKKTLAIIKKVLKHMKMPSDTKLVELRADREDVEHDLA